MEKTCSLNRKSLLRTGLAACVLLAATASGGPAVAAVIDFNFSSGATNQLLASSVTVNGVTAEGFQTNSNLYIKADLFRRNQTNDHGLGVCSSAEQDAKQCAIDGSGGGDWNELSNESGPEFIRLTRPDNYEWSSLWVSSLDSGGTDGDEEGLLLWSKDDPTGFSDANSVAFTYVKDGPVEFDLFATISIPSALRNAKYLLFTHLGEFGTEKEGTNNDYLVWKGAVTGREEVPGAPEPATIALMSLALVGVGAARRRRK